MKYTNGLRYLFVFLLFISTQYICLAQLQVNQVEVDSMEIRIGKQKIQLKKLKSGDYRAWIPIDLGFRTFTFNPITRQITSRLEEVERKYMSDEYVVVNYIECDSSRGVSRKEFNHVCYGIFHGEYAFHEEEYGGFWRDALQGTVSLPNERGSLKADTVTYNNGQKQGLEVCEKSRRIIKKTYYRGEVWQERMFSTSGTLLSVKSFKPKYLWMEFYESGDTKRIYVTDSVHMYFENKKLSYSLLYNQSKKVWEEKAFYSNGKVKRYLTHKGFKHSPISEPIYYDENGKILSVPPDPEFAMETNYYCTVSSKFESTYAFTVRPNEILTILPDSLLIPIMQQASILDEKFKVKKKYVGDYNFDIEFKQGFNTSIFFTQYKEDDKVPNTYRDHFRYQTIDYSSVANYPINYIKLHVKTELAKP